MTLCRASFHRQMPVPLWAPAKPTGTGFETGARPSVTQASCLLGGTSSASQAGSPAMWQAVHPQSRTAKRMEGDSPSTKRAGKPVPCPSCRIQELDFSAISQGRGDEPGGGAPVRGSVRQTSRQTAWPAAFAPAAAASLSPCQSSSMARILARRLGVVKGFSRTAMSACNPPTSSMRSSP